MIHNDATPEDRGRSGDLRGARRRRAADLRAGDGAADGAALFPVLSDAMIVHHRDRRRARLQASGGAGVCRSSCARRAGCARRLRSARRRAVAGARRGAARRRLPAAPTTARVVRGARAPETRCWTCVRRPCRARARRLPSRQPARRRCRSATAGCASPMTTCCARWSRGSAPS